MIWIMLKTDRKFPMIAKRDINCFKVMVERNDKFYVCPPVLQHFLNNNIELVGYELNTLYFERLNDSKKDYRKGWVIGEWFFHTFADIESAKDFVDYLTQRINNKSLTKRPELYKLPPDSKLVILNAIIPEGSLYYEWNYKEIPREKTYASNRIIYNSFYKNF